MKFVILFNREHGDIKKLMTETMFLLKMYLKS